MNTLLETKEVSKYFGAFQALDAVSIQEIHLGLRAGFDADKILDRNGTHSLAPFPEANPPRVPVKIVSVPYTLNLEPGKKVKFVLKSEYIADLVMIQNDDWTYFKQDGDTFSLEFVPEAGPLKISVQY